MLSHNLLEKYSVNVPRYTSYPPAPEWSEDFKAEDFLRANDLANKNKTPVSLYFHLPFCESRCYFCACNVVISKKKSIVNTYLEHIKKEISRLGNLINKNRSVEQIHLGGGTPTYFNPDELKELFNAIKENFNISETCEAGVEVDPRVTTFDHLKTLSELGFNRISMGIQDFDPRVQETINRIQSFEETKKIFEYSRSLGFESINADLIYGLPLQTMDRFKRTLDLIFQLDPDRIAFFHYAHLPQLLNHQDKFISENVLPSSSEKIEIFQHAVKTLTDNGYVFIGLDHFAKPHDELTQARKNKTLHRNFQGYTTKSGCDLYGVGITAISNVQNILSQNIKKINPYYETIDLNKMPLFRGFVLNNDDLLRREIIMKILCHGIIIKSEIEEKYDINFDRYFEFEIKKLKELEKDRLILNSKIIEVTSSGQYFLRNIACVFDHYLQRKDGKQKVYSKSI